MEKKFAKFVIGFFVFGLVFFGPAGSFLNGRLGANTKAKATTDGEQKTEMTGEYKPKHFNVDWSVKNASEDGAKSKVIFRWAGPQNIDDYFNKLNKNLAESEKYNKNSLRWSLNLYGPKVDSKSCTGDDHIFWRLKMGYDDLAIEVSREVKWCGNYKAILKLVNNTDEGKEIGRATLYFKLPSKAPSITGEVGVSEPISGYPNCAIKKAEVHVERFENTSKVKLFIFITRNTDPKCKDFQWLLVQGPNDKGNTYIGNFGADLNNITISNAPLGNYLIQSGVYNSNLTKPKSEGGKGWDPYTINGVYKFTVGPPNKTGTAIGIDDNNTVTKGSDVEGTDGDGDEKVEGPNEQCDAPNAFALLNPLGKALQYVQCIILLSIYNGIIKFGGEMMRDTLSISYDCLDNKDYAFLGTQSLGIQKAHASLSSQLNPDETVGDHGNKPMYIFNVWDSLRTFIDVFIVFVLIFVALANIFHISIDKYAVKKALPGLVLGVILANFSGFICRMILDAANLVIHWVTFGGDVSLLMQKVLSALGVWQGIEKLTEASFLGGIAFPGIALQMSLITFGLAFLFLLVIMIAVFIIWVMLAIRVIIIYVLYAISPIAFLSLGSPMTSGAFKRWWSELTNWAFMPVIMFFLLNLAGQLDNNAPESFSLLINDHSIMIGDVGSTMNNFIRPVLIIGLLYGAWMVPLKAKGFFGGAAGFVAGQMLAPGNAARSFIKKEGKDWAGIGADKVKSKVPFSLRGAAIKEKVRNQVDSDLRLTKAGAMGQDELFKEENRQRNSHKKDLDEAGVMDPVALADSLEKAQNKLQVEAVMQQALEQKSLKEFIEEVSNRNNPQSLKKLGVENKEVLEEMAQKFGGTETDASGNTRTIHEEREAIQEMAARIHGTTRDAVITDRTKGNELAASRFANSLGSLAKKTGQYGLFRATTAPGEFKSQGDLSKSAIENMRKTNDAEQFVGSLDADWIEIDKDAIFHDDNADDILTVMKTRPGKMKPSARKKIADLHRSGNLPPGRFRDALDHARNLASEHTTIQRQIESHDNEISNFQRQIEEANTAIAETEKNMGAGFRMDESVSDEIKRKKEEIERINRLIEQKQIDKTADIARLNEKTEEVKETEHLRSMGIV